jgi:putative peptidoglycan lipid II flippase
VTGLAIASDVGILMHTVVLAWLLHRKKMVSLTGLPWGDLTKTLVTAVFAGFASYGASRMITIRGNLKSDAISLTVVTAVWVATVGLGLWITKSNLLRDLRRKKAAAPAPPEPMVDRTTGGVEP